MKHHLQLISFCHNGNKISIVVKVLDKSTQPSEGTGFLFYGVQAVSITDFFLSFLIYNLEIN
jgi:hypothetical protein